MERIGDLLPDAGRATNGPTKTGKGSSSGPVGREGPSPRPDDRSCSYCGRELEAEFFDFPPALQRKYEKSGEWYFHPCTPECEQEKEHQEWESTRRDARVESLEEKSGLTKRLKRYTIANFKFYVGASAARAVERAEGYVRDWEQNREEGRGLYLCGGTGTGKTHIAVAMMSELIKRRRVPSLFVTVPEFLDNLRGAYNDPGREVVEWMDAVKNADLLVLDDLGAEKPNAWVRERIFVVVDHRYREALPTIFTSNIGPKDLAEQLGERTASRIIAMCEWVGLEGEDYRKTAARGAADKDYEVQKPPIGGRAASRPKTEGRYGQHEW